MKRQILRFGPWLGLLVLGTIATSRYAGSSPAPAPPQEYPHIRAAENALREARAELEHAAHDFCGHRKDALRDTDAALRQLHFAIECRR